MGLGWFLLVSLVYLCFGCDWFELAYLLLDACVCFWGVLLGMLFHLIDALGFFVMFGLICCYCWVTVGGLIALRLIIGYVLFYFYLLGGFYYYFVFIA